MKALKLKLVLAVLGVAQAPLLAQLPAITNQPASQAVWAGDNVTFSVGVSNVGLFTYQWQLDSNSVPNGIITTVAGNGSYGYSGDGGAATNASLNAPYGTAVDDFGNLFIADTDNHRIREVNTNGVIKTVAGNGSGSYSGDGGAATNASLFYPDDVAVDASGNLFIADDLNERIREVNTNGVILTVAGNGTLGFSGDGGPATDAELHFPKSVAVDGSGNLFIADAGNNRIREVNTNGIIATMAGNGMNGYAGDGGAATSARLNLPFGVAVDTSGNLFIADTGNNRIRQVTPNRPTLTLNDVTAANAGNYHVVVTGPNGSVTSRVATLTVATITNPPSTLSSVVGTTATFSVGVGGVTSSSYQWLKNGSMMTNGGNVSGVTTANLTLRKVQHADAASYSVVVTNIAGSETSSPALLTVVDWPIHIITQPVSHAVWAGGNVTFAAGVSGVGPFSYRWLFNHTNLPNNIITTVAGNGTNGDSGDGGLAVNASMNYPENVAVDDSGNLFIADNGNFAIREVSINGVITTIAGNGMGGHSGNSGAATNASLEPPTGVAADAAGNIFIADYWNNWIREVDTNGIITTVAGDNFYGYSGDGGLAINASLYHPGGVAVDKSGDLFIADSGNNRIRKVDTNGIITTVAGGGASGGTDGLGDGGLATNAILANPFSVAVDTSGNLFIADEGDSVIRKVDTNGIITTVAGIVGAPMPAGFPSSLADYGTDLTDGMAATNVSLDRPCGVAVDIFDNLFIADTFNYRILEVSPSGRITTVAGKGPGWPVYGSYSGDGGPATNANLNSPSGVAVDASGDLFIADQMNQRIRKVTNTQGPTLALNNVTGANAGTYQVVVTGSDGSVTSSIVHLIVTAAPLAYQTALNPEGDIALNFLSQPGSTNLVLCATNLSPPVMWQPISTNIAGADGDWQFTDTNAVHYQTRFYRSLTQ